MPGGWFESVAEAERRARRTLPKSVYKAVIAGSERGTTMADNLAAFGELGFAPHVAEAPAERRMGVTVLGQELALPVLISPTGVQAVHPEGELAVARAAAARGTAIGLSSFGSQPVEEVVAANPQTFFQTYWCGTRERLCERLERARAAGVAGLIVTLDWQFSHGRDWGSPSIPDTLDLKTMLSFAPETIIRPRWLLAYARAGGPPALTVPNMTIKGEEPPTFFAAYGEWMGTPAPTWEDLRWLISWWDGPVMIKGIARPDDARRALDAGATAISVSNHGGNNLDGQPASIRTLPGIVAAVGGELEILLDSGVRRGSDVVKALALGARATMIGRAYLWGLAANGQAGVENVLDILSGGIDSALRGLGRASISELAADDLLVPGGFERGAVAPR
jgi:heme/flavin dehydrogenase (mycofactocin system)